MKLSKEVKVGLLALTAGVILYIGFNFLKGIDFLSPTNRYYVIYDNIDGLTAANPVMVNGLSVGRVGNIKLIPGDNRLLVALEVQKEVLLTDRTLAKLTSSDILGGKSIELEILKGQRTLVSGDTLLPIKEKNITEQLSEKALPILQNIDSTVSKVNHLFGDRLEKAVTQTLDNIEDASRDLQQMMSVNKKNVHAISGNLVSLTNSLKETEKSVKPLIAKMNAIADSLNDLELKQAINNANNSLRNLENITARIDQGQGNLGKLVNDSSLYTNLNSSLTDLDNLLIDFQNNPKRYVNFSVISIGSGEKRKQKEERKAANNQ
ncbi:MAG: MlaD family protein [Cytophagaceae bacterium]